MCLARCTVLIATQRYNLLFSNSSRPYPRACSLYTACGPYDMSVYVSQCSTDKRSLVGHMSTRIIRPANNDFHLANNNIQLVAITAASVSAIASLTNKLSMAGSYQRSEQVYRISGIVAPNWGRLIGRHSNRDPTGCVLEAIIHRRGYIATRRRTVVTK